jgi:hypothetical protein
VYEIGDLQTFTSKQKGEEFVKRSVRIADQSKYGSFQMPFASLFFD